MTEMCLTRKCGVRFSPPAVIVVYDDIVNKKTRKYVMPVRNFRVSSNINFIAHDLKTRHNKVLNNVPLVTIEKMLRLIQEHMKGIELDTAIQQINKEFTVAGDEDLNKLSTEVVQRKKEIMDLSFNKNRVTPDDPNFVYDKRVVFDEEIKSASAWDEEQEREDKHSDEPEDDFWNE